MYPAATIRYRRGCCHYYCCFMQIPPDILRQTEDLESQARKEGIELFCTGAAIVRDGKILLVTRALHDEAYAGHDEIPGGGIDPGETILEGLVREVKEETGLTVKHVLKVLSSFDFQSIRMGKPVRQFSFLVEPEDGEVVLDPNEHSAYFWLDPADLSPLETRMITSDMKELILSVVTKASSQQ
jgi:8-oxo-dGTP diphosphatase